MPEIDQAKGYGLKIKRPINFGLVAKDGTQKRHCCWCEQMRSDTYCTNPTFRKVKREYMCEECHQHVLGIVEADCRRQVAEGIPRGEVMVMIPLRGGSDRLVADIRAMVRRIDSELTRTA